MIQPSQERETFQCGAAANQRAGSRGPLPGPASRLGCPPPLDAPVTEAPLPPLPLPGPSPKDSDCNPFDSDGNPNESSGPPMPWAPPPPAAPPAEPRSGGAPFWGYCQHKSSGFQSESFGVAAGGRQTGPPRPPRRTGPPRPPPAGCNSGCRRRGGAAGGGGGGRQQKRSRESRLPAGNRVGI